VVASAAATGRVAGVVAVEAAKAAMAAAGIVDWDLEEAAQWVGPEAVSEGLAAWAATSR